MKALVIYDSFFGNTEKIAQVIGEALGSPEEVSVVKVDKLTPDALSGVDLLVVGSPTRAFRPSPNTSAFLKGLASGSLRGVKTAAFDTGIEFKEVKPPILRFMAGLFGYAAPKIAKQLKAKGGTPAQTPETFIVTDSEGPLKPGEVERAAAWAKQIH